MPAVGAPLQLDQITRDLCNDLSQGGCPLAGALAERLRFEKLLVELSAKLVNLPAEQIDEQINHGLTCLGQFLGIDRSSFAQFSSEREDMIVTHCYVAPGIRPFAPIIVERHLPWYARQIRGGEIVRFERLPHGLPEEAAAEREYCVREGLKSNLAIPLKVNESLRCVITFATFREHRNWPDEMVQRLWLVGEIFASALARKQAEEEMLQLREQLARIGRVTLVGELAAAIAHEINQPLCAIISNAQAGVRMTSRGQVDVQTLHETFADVSADGSRAHDIIARTREMLQKRVPQRAALFLNPAIEEVIQLIRFQLERSAVAVSLDLDPELPQVLADRVQLQQVVLNLALNAVDALSAADVEARRLFISTSSYDADHVLVTVLDTGPGIRASDLQRIFDSFFTTKPTGIGVGLAISRSIVEAHGGRIWVDSQEGEGAAFHFTLPILKGPNS
jgi:signal transduction histidine kinase